MRRDELQREVLEALPVRALGGALVLRDARPILAIGIEALQALAVELDLAGLRLQPLEVSLRVVGG